MSQARSIAVRVAVAVSLSTTLASSALAQTSARPALRMTDPMTVHAARASRTPVIDGRLDDAAWAAAQSVSGFTQQTPNPGSPATQPTDVRVLTDADAIYVAMR